MAEGGIRDLEISRIFCEVVERQAFLFADPIGIDEFEPGDRDFLETSIHFTGASPGTLTLVAPADMAREIAANVMGVSESDPAVEANHRDALGEILNVLCGHILSALNGDHAIHDLSIPTLADATALQAAELANRPSCLAFSVEDHKALLLVDFLTPGETDPGIP